MTSSTFASGAPLAVDECKKVTESSPLVLSGFKLVLLAATNTCYCCDADKTMVLCPSDPLSALRTSPKVLLVCSSEHESNYWAMLNKAIVRKTVET